MNPSGLAHRFAVVGLLGEILFLSFWALAFKFNFFHLPTAGNMPTGNYNAPASLFLIRRLNFVVCPPLVFMIFGMDLGLSANLVLAAVVVAMNGALYFIVGLLVGLLSNRFLRRSPQKQVKIHLDD